MANDDNVKILSWPDTPAGVNLNVAAASAFPVCIKVCEPICARSAYVVTIDIFDRNVATIKLEGQTIIANCGDQPAPVK
jgi:hypothetical protein